MLHVDNGALLDCEERNHMVTGKWSTMLSEISQSMENKQCVFSHIETVRKQDTLQGKKRN